MLTLIMPPNHLLSRWHSVIAKCTQQPFNLYLPAEAASQSPAVGLGLNGLPTQLGFCEHWC